MIFNLFIWTPYFSWLCQRPKRWTQLTTFSLASGIATDLIRNRTDLMIENAILRQQLIILNRQVKKPRSTSQDRFWMVLFARCTRFWKQAVLVVQPETVLRWHRDLFRFYWRRKSRKKEWKSRIASETIGLIREMAEDNRLWGAERIHGIISHVLTKKEFPFHLRRQSCGWHWIRRYSYGWRLIHAIASPRFVIRVRPLIRGSI